MNYNDIISQTVFECESFSYTEIRLDAVYYLGSIS